MVSLFKLIILLTTHIRDLALAFKCVNSLAPDYLVKYFVKHSAVHNRNIVDRQLDKGRFAIGVQGNGVG